MVLDRSRTGLRLGVVIILACLLGLAPAASRAATEIIISDDFESDFGSFLQVAGDDFDWSRDSGGTPSQGTGPSIDHTLVTAFDQISSTRTWGKRWV